MLSSLKRRALIRDEILDLRRSIEAQDDAPEWERFRKAQRVEKS